MLKDVWWTLLDPYYFVLLGVFPFWYLVGWKKRLRLTCSGFSKRSCLPISISRSLAMTSSGTSSFDTTVTSGHAATCTHSSPVIYKPAEIVLSEIRRSLRTNQECFYLRVPAVEHTAAPSCLLASCSILIIGPMHLAQRVLLCPT